MSNDYGQTNLRAERHLNNPSYEKGHFPANPPTAPQTADSRKSSFHQSASILFGLLILILIMSWLLAQSKATLAGLPARNSDSSDAYNQSAHGPAYTGITQLQHLDPTHLPGDLSGKRSGKRLVIVGDVHGCESELNELLDSINFRKSHDHLILTGDMINKGPSSLGVIQLLRSLDASGVRGNHEDLFLRLFASPEQLNITSGVPKRKEALEELARKLSRDEVAWIANCPLILSLGTIPGLPHANTVVVHAGLVPNVALEDQNPFSVMNMRSIDERTMQPMEHRDEGTKWWKVWNEAQKRLPPHRRMLVVYGHDAKQGLVKEEYSIGLDSGCVKGGSLSALIIGVDELDNTTQMKIRSVKCRGYM